jgi:methylmalonyl-CoA/ethylmalonyl-CoA epimerase
MTNDWKMHHIGFIVRDMQTAISVYQALGAVPLGPEAVLKVERKGAEMRIRSVQLGSIEIEFIMPVKGETMQAQYLEERGEGIQHIAYTVDDLDTAVEFLAARGIKPMFTKELSSGSRYAYFMTGSPGDVRLELIQLAR